MLCVVSSKRRNVYFSDYNVSTYKSYPNSCCLPLEHRSASSWGVHEPSWSLPGWAASSRWALVLVKGPVPTDTSPSGNCWSWFCYMSECLKRGREGEASSYDGHVSSLFLYLWFLHLRLKFPPCFSVVKSESQVYSSYKSDFGSNLIQIQISKSSSNFQI